MPASLTSLLVGCICWTYLPLNLDQNPDAHKALLKCMSIREHLLILCTHSKRKTTIAIHKTELRNKHLCHAQYNSLFYTTPYFAVHISVLTLHFVPGLKTVFLDAWRYINGQTRRWSVANLRTSELLHRVRPRAPISITLVQSENNGLWSPNQHMKLKFPQDILCFATLLLTHVLAS